MRLLLDAGGVLVTNGVMTAFFATLGLPQEAAWAEWQARYRAPFWRGEIGIDETFDQMRSWATSQGGRHVPYDPHQHMTLLPWAHDAAVLPCRKAVLSNHRHEWLLPALRPIASQFDAIFVSDMLRTRKPEPAAFTFALCAWGVHDPSEVIFVDDQAQNLDQARSMGMRVVKADPASRSWVDVVGAVIAAEVGV